MSGKVKVFLIIIPSNLVDVQYLHGKGKWSSMVGARLQTKRLWDRFLLQLLKCQILRLFGAKISLTLKQRRVVQTQSKRRMWHRKNTQLKIFLPLHTVLLNYFIYIRVLRHLRFYMVKQFQSCLSGIGPKRFLYIWSEKCFLSFKFFTTDP